jgi:CBS domain-containing protein
MWIYDCGSIPVCNAEDSLEPIGVVTDRDICMCALFNMKPLRELRVADAMAKNVLVCRPGDTVEAAEKIMRASHVRRLPVVDEGHALLGMVSLADLAREAARERESPRQGITENEVCGTLAAICEPARTLIA